MEMLTRVEQIAVVFGTFATQTEGIAKVADGAGEIDIRRVHVAGAFIVTDVIGIGLPDPLFVSNVRVVVVGQLLNAGAKTGFQLCLFAEGVYIVRLDRPEAGRGRAGLYLVCRIIDGRSRLALEVIRGIVGSQ